jgi:GH25 family lysozyme M1 (1,4-beta-N-acetylmuramidase)
MDRSLLKRRLVKTISRIVTIASLAVMSACGGAGEKTGETADEVTVCPSATVEGIDVSYFQGNIDFAKVAASGRKFAFIRVSDGHFADPKFATYWQDANAAGLHTGAYHFFRPTQDPSSQADFFLQRLPKLGKGNLPAVLDVEVTDGASAWTIGHGIDVWIAKVAAATGKKPLVYTSPGFWASAYAQNNLASRADLWTAHWFVSCPSVASSWGSWRFWQYHDNGSVPGISGPVDLDRFDGTLSDLEAYAGGGAAGATHFENAGKWLTGFGGPDWAGVGDFDGDGRSDIAWYESWNDGSITVALSNGGSFVYAGKWLSGFGAPDWAGVGDFDGDGRSDIAWYEGWNGGSITVVRSNGHGFEYGGKWITGWGKPDWAGVGDFDGDGKSDIAWYEAYNGHAITIGLSTGQSIAWAGHWISGWGAPDWAGVGDFDGDGRSDIAWYESWNDGSITVALSNGGSFVYAGKWLSGWGKPDRALVGDFDGDGKSDVAWYEAWNDHAITVGLSNGSSIAWAGHWISGWGTPDWSGAGDFDGDGRGDIAWYEAWNDHAITIAAAR